MSQTVSYELSNQQRELLAAEAPGTVLRNRVVLDAGEVQAGEVARALIEAAAMNEVLRTTFQRPSGLRELLQVVSASPAVHAQVADSDEDHAALPEVPLDATVGPTLVARLARRDGRRALVLEALASVADVETLAALGASILGRSGARDGAPATTGGDAEEPLAYAEYAAWQAGLPGDGSEEEAEAKAYLERLQAFPATELALLPEPAGGHDGPAFTGGLWPGAWAEAPIEVEEELRAGLAELAERAGGTAADSWLALWSTAISRVVGEGSVVLGVDLDTREGNEELTGAAGPYRRMVPMVLAPGQADLATLITQVLRERAAAQRLAHRFPVPTKERRTGAGRPVLLFSTAPEGAWLGRWPFQLELRVGDRGEAKVIAGPLASPGDAAEAAAWLASLASQAMLRPAVPLAGLVMASPARAEALLSLGTGPATMVPEQSLVERIAAWAINTPDAEAVFDGTTSLTYRDLLAGADRLAATLLATGPVQGPVALFLERSAQAVMAILGVWRAGATYLPLATDQPAVRVTTLLSEAGVQTVVTTEGQAGQLPPFAGRVVTLEHIAAATPPATPAATPPATPAAANPVAYVLYTSGSTGAPKAVEVGRDGLANYVESVLSLLGPSDRPRRFALVSSLATDLGHTCLFPALVSGGTLDVVPAPVAADPDAFATWGRDRPQDVLKITPSHLATLLASEQAEVLPREVLLLGGEASTWALVDRIGALGSCRVLNHYGPTETTVGCLVYDSAQAHRHRSRPLVPIGRPLPNTEVLIVAPDLTMAPAGAKGELCIGGAGLANGYLNDPQRTADRFVPHPYRPGTRLYRTGDQARLLSDGTFEFLGREDGQVKVRGFRVECGEVEEAMRKHRQVQRAAVVLREDEPGQARLVGYFVSHFHPSPDADELRHHLLALLPDYMVPVAFVELGTIPLGPSGKLDRTALPVPELTATTAYEAPRTPIEQELVAIFADLLGAERVGVHDDFFELGGHSLLATQVVVRARSAFNINLPVHALFLSPTVASLAQEVEKERTQASVGDGEMEAMMEAIAALSDEEAAALLAEQRDEADQ